MIVAQPFVTTANLLSADHEIALIFDAWLAISMRWTTLTPCAAMKYFCN